MKIAITGPANSGKTTIFNALTRLNLKTTSYPSNIDEPHKGVVKVPDVRLEKLTDIFKPKKEVNAVIEYIDYIGLIRGDQNNNRKVFDLIKDVDAIIETVRVFKDDSIIHPDDVIDPLRDAEHLKVELIFSDLELIEKRFKSMEDNYKRGKKIDESEKKVLIKCREALEEEKPLRIIDFSTEELNAIRHLQFISIKPKIIVLNVSEDDLGKNNINKIVKDISKKIEIKEEYIIPICGKIEMELAQLSPVEADEFLDDLGIENPALSRLINLSYILLGLKSFFTVGKDETRAWTIKKDTNAHKAAGKIHSDIERGFIRAEVISYDDFIISGSMAEAKKRGLFRLEGKDYIVKDGDIINFRFNV